MRWIMVDLETTGLEPGYHDIMEFGAVRSDGVELAFSLEWDRSKAHPVALDVNGWGQREFADLLDHNQAAYAIQDLFEYHTDTEDDNPWYLVAWPTQFDVAFLHEFHRRQGIPAPWHYRNTIDVRSFASALYGVGFSLEEPVNQRRWGITRQTDDGEHTALGDARYQAEVFKAILDDRDRALRELREIGEAPIA